MSLDSLRFPSQRSQSAPSSSRKPDISCKVFDRACNETECKSSVLDGEVVSTSRILKALGFELAFALLNGSTKDDSWFFTRSGLEFG